MKISDIDKITQGIDGWLIKKEGELLYNLAKNCKGNGVIVEIGSWKGKSTIWLGYGASDGKRVKIYAIDPHTGSPEHQNQDEKVWTFNQFWENIKKCKMENIVTPIIKTSEEAAKDFNEKVEFVFIDGAHEYEMVELDFKLWFPKLIEGGIMTFHDSAGWGKAPSVEKVVIQNVYNSRHFRNVRFQNSITYAQKVENNTLFERLSNKINLILKLTYDFLSLFKKKLNDILKPSAN